MSEIAPIIEDCERIPVSDNITIDLMRTTDTHINGILEDVLDVAVTGREITIRR